MRLSDIQSSADLASNLDTVIAALGDSNQCVRIQGAKILGRHGGNDVVVFLSIALNDRIQYVADAAAAALAQINTELALKVLCDHFAADTVDRPHYFSHAIAQFGERGLVALLHFAESESPTLRYFAARGLGETGADSALPMLERIAAQDSASTRFGALVSTAAKHGLKTWTRVRTKCSPPFEQVVVQANVRG